MERHETETSRKIHQMKSGIWHHKKVQENKNYSGEARVLLRDKPQCMAEPHPASPIDNLTVNKDRNKSSCTNVGIKAETLIYGVWKDARLRTLDENLPSQEQ